MVSNFVSRFLSKSITSLIGGLFFVPHIKNPGKGTVQKVPDDFKPVLRFAVCSDIHLNGDPSQDAAVRFGNLFDDMYSYSALSSYKGFDAVLVAGDFSGGGDEKEYEMFNTVAKAHLKDGTSLLTILGNHEFINYRDYDATIGYDVFKKHISENTEIHTVINGYHFIGVSYDNDGKKFTGKLDLLRKELISATADDKNKPVFVFQHPHPFGTVYGSINWGTYEVRKVLKDFPAVVNFSGHSHYAPSDPRSVWQGSFTAVGCGSLSAFMGNLNYIDGDKDAPGKSGGFRLVEADANGNIRMRLYDIENREFFSDCEYYFTNLTSSRKRTYTWHKQKSLDTAPAFPKNANVTLEKDENAASVLSFPDARGFYFAENYKITVTSGKDKVFSSTVLSGYVRTRPDGVKVNLGNIPDGTYKIKITAYSPYAKCGETLKKTLSV